MATVDAAREVPEVVSAARRATARHSIGIRMRASYHRPRAARVKSFAGSAEIERERMNLGAQLGPEGVVDESVARQPTHSAKTFRSHPHAKVTGAAGRAGVAAVEVALVDDLDRLGGKGRAQKGLDPGAPIHRRSMGQRPSEGRPGRGSQGSGAER